MAQSHVASRPLHNVSRRFGSVRAVDGVTLDIAEGEFFAMLGPSGSGKTTCLRLIAGFEQPDEGHIEIFGETAEGVPPYKRNVNTVFQDYALFPHMTVGENVAYGLMIKGVARAEREAKARDALAMVKLAGYEERRPAQLSGGQRQRVALARALVNGPKVLLLDEPLGALDLKLREQMQEELKALQKELGITFVFVTHDQGEALSMANRVAIFNEGKIVQVGTPADVYERPAVALRRRFRRLLERAFPRIRRPATAEPASGPASGPRRSACSRRARRCRPRAPAPTADQDRSAIRAPSPASASRPRTAHHRRGAGGPAALQEGDSVRLIWPKSAMVTMEDGA